MFFLYHSLFVSVLSVVFSFKDSLMRYILFERLWGNGEYEVFASSAKQNEAIPNGL
jgi:hypothetical protein